MIDEFQLSIFIREKYGSSAVWDIENHSVAFLEGEWSCNCESFIKKYKNRGLFCRHIYRKMSELKDERISLLESQITTLMERTVRGRARGLGAHYGIKKLNEMHREILLLLSELGDGDEKNKMGRPQKWIRINLRKRRMFGTDTAIGGRVSELLGGLIRTVNGEDKMTPLIIMTRNHRVECDDEGNFRFVETGGYKLPLYRLSEAGWDLVNTQFAMMANDGD